MQSALQTPLIEELTELTLAPGTLDIGRAAGNHIAIDDPAVSQYHARIVTYFHESFLLDLNSEHGTFLNGERIIKHSIKEGDEIQFGAHRFVVNAANK